MNIYTSADFRLPAMWAKIFNDFKNMPTFFVLRGDKSEHHFSMATDRRAYFESIRNVATGFSCQVFSSGARALCDLALSVENIVDLSEEDKNSQYTNESQANPCCIVGMGSNEALNLARKERANSLGHCVLVHSPESFSTDSFFSDKYRVSNDSSEMASRTGHFPDYVIIPLSVVLGAPGRVNNSGIGEGLALVSAVHELLLTGDEGSTSATDAVAEVLVAVLNALGSDRDLPSLAFALTMLKAGIMWAMDNNRWGAGSEHLVAYALEELYPGRFLHGEGCAFGAWLVCLGMCHLYHALIPQQQLQLVLQKANLFYSPSTTGLTGDDVFQVLAATRAYRRNRPCFLHSLRKIDLTMIAEIWEATDD